MKTFIYSLLFASLALPVSGYSELINIEDAIEAASVKVQIDQSLNGTISVSPCDKCKHVSLKINADTQAEHNGKHVHLNKIKSLNGKPATVVYDVKTRTAVKVIW